MPDTRSDIARQRLAGLREQRRQALLGEEILRDRIKTAVAEAQDAGVPMSRIAEELGIDRSTLYRVYLAKAA